MAKSSEPPAQVPQWQQAKPSEASNEVNSPDQDEESPSSPSTSSPDTLREQASKFLSDPSIRDAPTESKIAFLESKGLSKEDIQMVLEPSSSTDPFTPPKQVPSTDSSKQTPSTESPRSSPPIITYPEFLLTPTSPAAPPLLTAPHILQILTLAASISTISYTAARYVVSPMTAQLSAARHDFFASALSQLESLNSKLSSAVSVIPLSLTAPPQSHHNASLALAKPEDGEEEDEDPTELFHLDAGTQTSPHPSTSRLQSLSSSSTSSSPSPTSTLATTTQQSTDLRKLSTHLASLVQSASDLESADESVSHSVDELRTWLEGVAYSNLWSGSAAPYGGNMYANIAGGGGGGGTTGMGGRGREGEDEMVGKVKAEIRGIKGALLSARNFPVASSASGGVRAGGGR